MLYEIVSERTPDRLTFIVQQRINEGWKPYGTPMVAELHHQNRYSGTQHMDTVIELEYSQAVTKDF